MSNNFRQIIHTASEGIIKPQNKLCVSQQNKVVDRRFATISAISLTALVGKQLIQPQSSNAVQGYATGMLPGLTKEADADGFFTYTRPEEKMGGHGIGWTEIPRYSFKVPAGWQEKPTSIADLSGTEIDLRYASEAQGDISVIVAPVLRFRPDFGLNADVRIKQIASPENLITGFGLELFGRAIEESDILEQSEFKAGGLDYLLFKVKPHALVSITSVANRVFILLVQSNPRQWRRNQDTLKAIQESFRVPIQVYGRTFEETQEAIKRGEKIIIELPGK